VATLILGCLSVRNARTDAKLALPVALSAISVQGQTDYQIAHVRANFSMT